MKQKLSITLKNVKTHNLRSISTAIEHGSITVVTGLSGSGKSSLAIDTLYAEGQRRYIESLSPYARQFLERMERPPVESVSGMLPAICIEAKNVIANARSTVGTQTEINDFLRIVMARIGTMFCPGCESEVKIDAVDRIQKDLLTVHAGAYAAIVFSIPVEKASKDHVSLYVRELAKQGYTRLLVGGSVIKSEDALSRSFQGDADKALEVVLDRVKLIPANQRRLADSLSTAYARGHDHLKVAIFSTADLTRAEAVHAYSAVFACSRCKKSFQRPEPNLFSFNSPIGACPECEGFGRVIVIDRDRIVPDVNKSLFGGAIEPWEKPSAEWERSQLIEFCKREKIPLNIPFKKLKKADIKKIFEGVPTGGDYFSVNAFFEYLEKKKYKMHVRVFLSRYRNYITCSQCHGARLRPAALQVKVSGRTIYDIQCMKIQEAAAFFETLPLSETQMKMIGPAMTELRNRLKYLDEVGLGYLTLDRMSRTLSGGEMQRINLATALGTQLVDTLYVLDEPSIGLHERDNKKLIGIVRHLKELGNTIVLIEHDAQIIKVADQVIDLGPGAGIHGGEVLYSGDHKGLLKAKGSHTANYLRGEEKITRRRRGSPADLKEREALVIQGAREHNLKKITVSIPLQQFVVVTGVSGAGKSSLVFDVLYKNYLKYKGEAVSDVGAVDAVKGFKFIDNIVYVDQSTLGRSLRSCPATYTGAYSDIRALFAATREARSNGLEPAAFSFNTRGGRCEKCEGLGVIKEEMHFLADVLLKCEDCDGKRFTKAVLKIRWNGKSITDVLNMTVDQAAEFFKAYPAIVKKLSLLDDVGLGYLTLGQSSSTLSAGEAQRLKLAVEMLATKGQRQLFIFDEPTVGLHYHDIAVLMKAFDKLLDEGNSIIVIEHNMEVIKCADTIIDLGPEGGDDGGEIVFCGTPAECARATRSHTGMFLKEYL